MITFERTEEFDVRLVALRDKVSRARIIHRTRSAEHGNFGDCDSVGEEIFEFRVHVRPGYRAYVNDARRGGLFVLLGGDKFSQKRDIKRAIEMAQALDKD